MTGPSWYQRWFGYTPEYQHITWGLVGYIAVGAALVLSFIAVIVALIWWTLS
jgi:hypothetical protein